MLPILPLHRKYAYRIFPNKRPGHLRMWKGGGAVGTYYEWANSMWIQQNL